MAMNRQKYRVVRYETTLLPDVEVVGAQQTRVSREVIWSAPELPSLRILEILSRARVTELPLDLPEKAVTIKVQEKRHIKIGRTVLPLSRYVTIESHPAPMLPSDPENL